MGERARLLSDYNGIANTAQNFTYRGLELRPETLRLVQVLPSTLAGRLRCILQVLPADTEYTTLSYRCGTDMDKKQILINGYPALVRHNLWEFLRVARCNYHCWFWIDEICINQHDDLEKTRVVQSMGQIYSNGVRNISWLGDHGNKLASDRTMPQDLNARITITDNDSSMQSLIAALDAISWTDDAAEFHRPIQRGEFLKAFWLLENVCKHSYWTRLWIVQEVFLSKRTVILFSNITVSWAVLVKLISLIVLNRNVRAWSLKYLIYGRSCRQTLEMSVHACARMSSSKVGAEDVGYSRGLSLSTRFGALLLCKIRFQQFLALETIYIHDVVQGSPAIMLLLGNLGLTTVLEQTMLESCEENPVMFMANFRDLKCSDRRDRIFALLSLTSIPTEDLVSYNSNVYDLFYKACHVFTTNYAVSHAGVLDAYARLGSPTQPAHFLRSKHKQMTTILMEHLRLGPLDLVFGDSEHRTQVKYTIRSPDSRQTLPRTTMLHTVTGLNHGFLNGVCERCGTIVHYHVQDSWPSRHVLLQCHAKSRIVGNDNSDVSSEIGRSHVLFYTYGVDGEEMWDSLFQPQTNLRWWDTELFLSQIKTRWLPQTPSPARLDTGSSMLAMIGLHTAWHQADLDVNSRMFYFLKFGNLTLNHSARKRRRLADLSSLAKTFKNERRPGSINHSMIKALKLEEQAEKNLLAMLEQEGYKVQYQSILTKVLGCCMAY